MVLRSLMDCVAVEDLRTRKLALVTIALVALPHQQWRALAVVEVTVIRRKLHQIPAIRTRVEAHGYPLAVI